MKMAPASSPACKMGEGAKDATNGFCLKRIDDDDKRCESSSFYGNSDDSILSTLSSDLTDDATSTSPSSSSLSSNASQFGSNPSSFDLSSLVGELPIKRGLSKYFEGKSESFRSLSDARCIEDLVKKVNPSRKRLKASGDHGFNSTQKHCNRSTLHGRTTSKKTSRGSIVSSLARRNRSTALFSSKMLKLPLYENQILAMLKTWINNCNQCETISQWNSLIIASSSSYFCIINSLCVTRSIFSHKLVISQKHQKIICSCGKDEKVQQEYVNNCSSLRLTAA